MKWTPRLLRRLLNIYGPYLGAGVRVTHISDDWRALDVEMKLRFFNRNYVGVHFGGSLYSMVDPHLMLLLIHLLGKDYVVWDKAAEIEFVKPGRGKVRAAIRVTDEDLEEIRAGAEENDKYLPRFELEVVDEENGLVARVVKILYVRKKRRE